MAQLHPFQALMPPPERVAAVSAPPYDVVDRAQVVAAVAAEPLTFLRVSRAEVDLPPDADPYDAAVYAQAAANFARLRDTAPLVHDARAGYYVYSQVREGRRQTGLVAAAAVDDYDDGTIRIHEATRPDKEDDRTRHTLALRAHSGPVFLVARDRPDFVDLLAAAQTASPLYDFTDAAAVRHQVWRLPAAATAAMRTATAAMARLYVADGHHRAKSASRAREACRAANPHHTGNEPYNRFLVVVFPASQVRIMAYNRIVRDGADRAGFLARVEAAFTVEPVADGRPAALGDIRMVIADGWRRLTPKTPVPGDPVARLDVSRLQDGLLAPVCGITDPRRDPRLDFVGGVHGVAPLERAVREEGALAAFSLYPTTVDQLLAVADAGRNMPPKSTWFEPKLRDGLLVHTF